MLRHLCGILFLDTMLPLLMRDHKPQICNLSSQLSLHTAVSLVSLSIVASHSLLLLETVLHSTPTIHPFDWLEHLLRVIAALFCVAEGLTSAELLAGYE